MSKPTPEERNSLEELKVNEIIKDNDPRVPNRKLRVTRIDAGYAWAVRHPSYFSGGREYRIKLSSIHTDGKERRSGFSRYVPSK